MFDRLVGNQSVKDLLRRMLSEGRVPGALLFAGEEGVGKKQFAIELAKAMNCLNKRGVEACEVCSACKRISRFNFPSAEKADTWEEIIWTDHGDVGMVVAPKRVLKVQQMRHIEREANYRPFEGRARIFLVEEADRLNDSSSNALLKILEEPPPTSHIILITSRPALLLTTIRSRCQAVRFSPIPAAEIEEYLVREKIAKGEEAKLLARCANGSIGRAINIDLKSYKAHRAPMLQLLNAIAVSKDRAKLLRVAETMNEANFKEDYEFRLELLETLIRDALVLALGAAEGGIVNEDLIPELKKVADRIDSHIATCWLADIENLRDQLTVNINRKPATDALFLRMASV
jgi:DNA polymerase-3 subunit delta'